MELREAISVVRKGRYNVTWWEESAKEYNKALDIVLEKSELVERIGGKMPEKKFWKGKITDPQETEQQYRFGYNQAIDDCTAAFAGMVPKVEELKKFLLQWKSVIGDKSLADDMAQDIRDLFLGEGVKNG